MVFIFGLHVVAAFQTGSKLHATHMWPWLVANVL